MTDYAKYLKIFNPEPDDDYTTKRETAIKAIAEAYKKKNNVDDLISNVHEISLGLYGSLGETCVDIVSKALKKVSPSFVAEDEDLQMVTCAFLGIHQVIESAGEGSKAKLSTYDVLAAAAWSAFSFKVAILDKPKMESLRLEIVSIAESLITNDSLSSRSRQIIPEFKDIVISEGEGLVEYASKMNKVFSSFAAAMSTNARLDREEIDVLWWVISDYSEIVNARISDLSDVQRAIVCGIEISNTLRRLPSRAHLKLALRGVDSNVFLTAPQILEELGGIVEKVVGYIGSDDVLIANPRVFPLLTCLRTGDCIGDDYNQSRTLEEWCGRAILENAMLKMGQFLNDRK